jgi:hypothetical protein
VNRIEEKEGAIYYYNEVGDCIKVETAAKNGWYDLWQQEKKANADLLTAIEEREGEIERIRGMEKDCKCPFCPIVERAGQAEVRDKACHDELLTIHTILACPAECPPVEDADEYIVRALKCYIHAMQMKERKDETS